MLEGENVTVEPQLTDDEKAYRRWKEQGDIEDKEYENNKTKIREDINPVTPLKDLEENKIYYIDDL